MRRNSPRPRLAGVGPGGLAWLWFLLALGLVAGCAIPAVVPAPRSKLTADVDRAESEINAALLRLGVSPAEVRTTSQATERSISSPFPVRWIERSYTLSAQPTFRNLTPADYVAAIREGARRSGARVAERRLAVGGQPSSDLRLTVQLPVRSGDNSTLVDVLVYLVRLPSPPPAPRPPTPPPPEPAGSPRIAIIIDDWGYAQPIASEFFALPAPLDMAVIPHLSDSRRLAAAGHAHGWEVLVHLPMQPLDARLDQGAGLIRVTQSDDEIRRLVSGDLADIPYAVGVNNHMGSRATADRRVMGLVLTEVAARGLFFVDSRTTAASVAARTAREQGLAYGENYAFLDGQENVEYVREALRRLVRTARADGFAIGIGHVRPHTLAALQAELPALLRSGVQLVPVSALVSPDFAYPHRPSAPPAESVNPAPAPPAIPPARPAVPPPSAPVAPPSVAPAPIVVPSPPSAGERTGAPSDPAEPQPTEAPATPPSSEPAAPQQPPLPSPEGQSTTAPSV